MTSMIHNFTSEAAIPTKKRSGGGLKAESSQDEIKTKKARSGAVNDSALPEPPDPMEDKRQVKVQVNPEPAVHPALISPPSLPLVAVTRDMILNAEDDNEEEELEGDQNEEGEIHRGSKSSKGSKKASGSSVRSNESKERKKASGGGKSSGGSRSKQQQPPSSAADHDGSENVQLAERVPMESINQNASAPLFRPAFGLRGPKGGFKPPTSTIFGQGDSKPSSSDGVNAFGEGMNQGYKVPGLRRKQPPRN